MSAGSTESEVLAQELESVGSKLLALETRLTVWGVKIRVHRRDEFDLQAEPSFGTHTATGSRDGCSARPCSAPRRTRRTRPRIQGRRMTTRESVSDTLSLQVGPSRQVQPHFAHLTGCTESSRNDRCQSRLRNAVSFVWVFQICSCALAGSWATGEHPAPSCRASAAALGAVGCVRSHDPLGFSPMLRTTRRRLRHLTTLCALRLGDALGLGTRL